MRKHTSYCDKASTIVEYSNEYNSIEQSMFFSEFGTITLGNGATVTLSITATTKPLLVYFAGNSNKLTQIRSFLNGTLVTPVAQLEYNRDCDPDAPLPTALVNRSAAIPTDGTQRGANGIASATGGNAQGGSSRTEKTLVRPGQTLSLSLTNLDSQSATLFAGIYWSEHDYTDGEL